MALNRDCTLKEKQQVDLIVNRILKTSPITNKLNSHRDILMVHLNGCPLDLDGLINASDADFYHDIDGIFINLNRETGRLEDYFVPRFSAYYKNKPI